MACNSQKCPKYLKKIFFKPRPNIVVSLVHFCKIEEEWWWFPPTDATPPPTLLNPPSLTTLSLLSSRKQAAASKIAASWKIPPVQTVALFEIPSSSRSLKTTLNLRLKQENHKNISFCGQTTIGAAQSSHCTDDDVLWWWFSISSIFWSSNHQFSSPKNRRINDSDD